MRINGGVVNSYNLCTATNTSGWVKHVVNLSAYVGQSVALQIRATTNGALNSNLFIDDVVFQPTGALVNSASPVLDEQFAAPRSR